MSDDVPHSSRRRRVRKSKPASATQGRDRWILSYADFITLLFAFFVALYSISLKTQGNDRRLTETLNGVFEAVQKSVKPINIGQPIIGDPKDQDVVNAKAIPANPPNMEEKVQNPVSATITPKSTIYDLLNNTINNDFKSLQKSGQISISESPHWINLELKSALLFGAGEYQLTNEAVALLIVISNILKSYPAPILVDGNTDNLPVTSNRLISNWHLSSLRASSVVDELVYRGVNPKLIAPIGFASEHPKVRNTNSEARQQNRRVVLRISKTQAGNLYDYLFK
ncbi:flagellar motor protein MotB [Marinomonas sp. TI.3.20]|uniref:OmpA family protein n=1 Tax=Marinomonas sp. TI.3.20 TaxID=3121296 RepID=UPI003120256A